jgi:hypothetical protein
LSPQTRRGRAAPASHRKSTSMGPAGASPRPEIEAELESEGSVAARHRTATPGVRRRGLARVRRSSMLRNAYEYVKEYIPLFVAFVLLFAVVWAYISFGPHAPTAKDHWTQIETKWKPKIDADRQQVSLAVNDFTAQQTAYKALRDDMRAWMADLSAVTDWSDARASASVNQATAAAVAQVISDGAAQASDLDAVVSAASANEVLLSAQTISADDAAFWADYATARAAIFAESATASLEPTIALPSGSLSPSASPGASGSPGASAQPSVSPS